MKKWFRWDYGRQNSGYSKMLLLQSKFFKFDCYILKIPDGVGVPEHTDPAVEGYEHHRMNAILSKPCVGTGQIVVHGPIRKIGERIMIFRPDLYRHSVTPVSYIWSDRSMYILSIGWLRKSK